MKQFVIVTILLIMTYSVFAKEGVTVLSVPTFDIAENAVSEDEINADIEDDKCFTWNEPWINTNDLSRIEYNSKKTDHESKTYKIGDTGPGGGLIFHIEGDKYFECSESLGLATWDDTFTLVENYSGGGYNDWYLPNKEELNYIYENLRKKGFISDNGWFWSSSVSDSEKYSGAWLQKFSNGDQNYSNYYSKSYTNSHVLVIRAFNPLTIYNEEAI